MAAGGFDGAYRVSADTPLGRRAGTVEIAGSMGPAPRVRLRVPGVDIRIDAASFDATGAFELTGTARYLLMRSPFTCAGTVAGGKISARARAAGAEIGLAGECLAQK